MATESTDASIDTTSALSTTAASTHHRRLSDAAGAPVSAFHPSVVTCRMLTVGRARAGGGARGAARRGRVGRWCGAVRQALSQALAEGRVVVVVDDWLPRRTVAVADVPPR